MSTEQSPDNQASGNTFPGNTFPSNQWDFDTLSVRAGYDPAQHLHASSVPIYETASYVLDGADAADAMFRYEQDGPIYSRLSNPTVSVLQDRLGALHGTPSALVLSSGMAAVSYALLNAADRGGSILTNYRLYGGSLDTITHVLPHLGISFDIVDDADDPEAYDRAITDRTRAIFVESISNPQTAIADIEALAEVAHRHGIILIVDNTVATPYLLNPFDHGADVVVYSATKAISGHGTAIAGAILESGRFNYRTDRYPQFSEPAWVLRDLNDVPRSILDIAPQAPFTSRAKAVYLSYLGATLGPFDAFLILNGLETLTERVDKQVSNAEAVARFLQSHDHVEWVDYPTLPGSGYEDLARRYLPRGAGSILSFGLEGGDPAIRRFIDAVRLFSYQANIGDAKSLIINPVRTTHIELDDKALANIQLPGNTIRLSLGLENPRDLIADLEQAFEATFAEA
ncbi:O-acetylhomoserine aminocarboxypropyltransferase/cysteine synthase family protein [Bifidobacterium simiarum]|uniref:O-acetylhomoserine aminocarboxypropyltransferase/cysteine synthase family protein n=1 Tax=Bifidobacterium simiarum TaxID=2045441 RepID=UPI001BDC881F|nr:aminotransferase class V-fold PLP-dependent enzyme [Bifidobacterium simiarum]MBT1166660.1 O-acetylhomoserine aminocarboxypropyltransferase/cysteine synthase [Bifidobacterium simiarum]